MRIRRRLSLLPVSVAAFLQLAAVTYSPNSAADLIYTTYSFSQSGWVDAATQTPVAGTLSISFDGSERGVPGYVIGGSAIGGDGISEFSLSWSGNSTLPAFTSLFNIFDSALVNNLQALLYHINENDFNGGQSIVYSPHLSAGRDFVCDPSVVICGNLTGLNGVALTTTRDSTPVPEPGSLALLMIAGLAAFFARKTQTSALQKFSDQ